MKIFLHSLIFMRRESFQSEFRLVFVAVVLTVTAIATIGLFADRISRALVNQSSELLGADQLIYSMRPIPDQWQSKARETGLQATEYKEFFSVVVVGDETHLTEVKAVRSAYPLIGKLEVSFSDSASNQSVIQTAIPGSGTAWVEPRLLVKLGIKPGDRVKLGKLDFVISAVIRHEPDRGGSLFSLAPRIMINHKDLDDTGLIGPGSRVRHRLLMAGTDDQLQAYRHWIKPLLGLNYELQTVRDSRPEVRVSLERAERFLSLTLIVTVVLASLTIWVAMQTWVRRRLVYAAVLRTVGLTRIQILRLFVGQLMALTFTACLVAVLLAIGFQSLLVEAMKSFITGSLPPIDINIALISCLAGTLLVLAFSLPTFIRLASASPNLVLRNTPDQYSLSYGSVLWGMVVLLFILGILIGDIQLLIFTLGGLLVTLLMLVLLSLLMLYLLRRVEFYLPVSVRIGVSALARHRRETITMMSVLGLSFLFVTLLTLVRTDLMDQWRDRLPEDTPNTFMVNVADVDRSAVVQWMKQNNLGNVDFYPMIKGRLIKHNQKTVMAENYTNSRAKRLVKREFNLSWSVEQPEHNSIVSGAWWGAEQLPQWSVEKGIAERLGIKVGDTLTYDVTGMLVAGRVTSIREVQWDSFKVNFFVLGQEAMLEKLPRKYISSFYLQPGEDAQMSDLVARFPSVTILDINVIMNRIRHVIDRVSVAADAAFGFTLLAAILLMMGMIQAGRKLRQQEIALLRTMGATSRILSVAQLTEFVILGAGSGLLAVLLANVLAWGVSIELLGFDFNANYLLAAGTMASGMFLAVVSAWIILKDQHRKSPLALLRKA